MPNTFSPKATHDESHLLSSKPFLMELLQNPELHRCSRVIETIHPDAAVLTAVALARRVQTLAIVVPKRALDGFYRALGEHLPETEVTAARWGAGLVELGPVVLIDERVFFDGIAAEPFEALLPEFDHLLFTHGDGLLDRLRRALRTRTADRRACGFVESRFGLGVAEGSTARISRRTLKRREFTCIPHLLRFDANRVFYLQRTRRGRELRSDVVSTAEALESFLKRSPVTVLGQALAVDGSLAFTMREWGLDGIGHVDPNALRDDLELVVPPGMPRYSERNWAARVIEEARKVVAASDEVTVIASAWNRDALGRALRSQLSGSVSIGHPDREMSPTQVLILDRLPLDVGEPVHAMERERTARWFQTVGLPRAVQKLRRLATRVKRGGAIVLLDGRAKSRWANVLNRAMCE